MTSSERVWVLIRNGMPLEAYRTGKSAYLELNAWQDLPINQRPQLYEVPVVANFSASQQTKSWFRKRLWRKRKDQLRRV